MMSVVDQAAIASQLQQFSHSNSATGRMSLCVRLRQVRELSSRDLPQVGELLSEPRKRDNEVW